MNFIQEYALLFAVATPFLVIVGINVYLWREGESGTMLLPSLKGFPAVGMIERAQQEPPIGYEAAPVVASAVPAMTEAVPANDVHVREAA